MARLSASATAGMLGKTFCSFGAETGGGEAAADSSITISTGIAATEAGSVRPKNLGSKHGNDDMSRNRQCIGDAAVVGSPAEGNAATTAPQPPRQSELPPSEALVYLRHAFGFNAFSVTRMFSDSTNSLQSQAAPAMSAYAPILLQKSAASGWIAVKSLGRGPALICRP